MSSKVAKFEEYARKQKEKKRIEEELIELRIENNNLKKEVEQLQNSINKLSFNNSHVLRAPLLKILGLINYIIEDSEEKSKMDLNALAMLKESCLELSEATEEVEKILNRIQND